MLDINKDQQIKASKCEEISKIAEQTVALKEQTEEIALSDSMAESRTSYALTLYSKISNISWDYAAMENKDLLAGCKY